MSWRLNNEYKENILSRTWEDNLPGEYWTKDRIHLSSEYQYDVYLLARQLAARQGLHRVLDVGSGPGVKAAQLLADIATSVTLIDQPTVATLAQTHCPCATFIGCDLETCEVELQQQHDLVICADVIEHLQNPLACFKLMQRLASHDAWFVISTPERDYLHGENHLSCEKPEHVREWNGSEFAALLSDMKFLMVEHWLCPQIRPESERGKDTFLMATPFTPAYSRPYPTSSDPTRACQICICRAFRE